MKRQPKLFDLLIQGTIDNFAKGPQRNHITRVIRTVLADAKRFCFDDAASEFMGQLIRRAGQAVLEQHEWARVPFPKTWVEINHKAYYEALLPPKERQPTMDGYDGDEGFGVLFNGNIAMAFSLGRLNGIPMGPMRLTASAAPWEFHLHEQSSYEHELEMAQYFGLSRVGYRQALLGALGGGADWWNDEADRITRSHRLHITPGVKGAMDQLSVDERRKLMIASAGELKIILTFLLLLTRPHKNMVMSEVSHKRTFHHGKPILLKAHSSITMRIEHDDPVTRYVGSLPSSIKRQLHDVRGHWAQSRKRGKPGCNHSWLPQDTDHFNCDCGAKRWWVKDHKRGSGQLGVVTSDYNVTR